jgi:hypothetical protein
MCKLTNQVQKDAAHLGELITETIKENKYLKESSFYSSALVESTDDIVYVTDIETNKILFVNAETKRLFGDVVGKICYSVFQNTGEPCSFCTNDKITKQIGKPHKWVFYNQKVDKLYYIVDIAKEVNGRLLRFERAINLNGEAEKIVEMFNKHKL